MEEKILALENQVTDLLKEREQLNQLMVHAESENQKLKTDLELAALEIKSLQEKNLQLEMQAAAVAGAKASKVEAPKPTLPTSTIEVEGKEYKRVGPLGFVLSGRRWTAEEAVLDAEVLTKILSLPGQTFLRELV